MSRPVHIVAAPGDRTSICGIKDPLPVIATKDIPRFRSLGLCPDCADSARNWANETVGPDEHPFSPDLDLIGDLEHGQRAAREDPR